MSLVCQSCSPFVREITCATTDLSIPPTLSTPIIISAELHTQILRYYHVEKCEPTIARQIRVHRDVIARVLAQCIPHGRCSTMRITPTWFILKPSSFPP